MIKHNFLLLAYNKDVTCLLEAGKEPICKMSARISRRTSSNLLPSHDPYIPRNDTILYNCSVQCQAIKSKSMTDLTSPDLTLKSCFQQRPDNYVCETIRYHYFKNADKVLFLSKTIRDKTFYTVDCLVYSGGERVCHKKDNVNSYTSLVDTGTLARPKEPNILSQDEFICEESKDKEVKCDLNPFVPFDDGLKLKDSIKFGDTVLLKSGSYVVMLKRKCIGAWCGYAGRVSFTRRQYTYRPPGDMVYRCYYANKQQVCKQWYAKNRPLYNNRGWLSS